MEVKDVLIGEIKTIEGRICSINGNNVWILDNQQKKFLLISMGQNVFFRLIIL